MEEACPKQDNMWRYYIPVILSKPPHEDIDIPVYLVPNPKEAGFRETSGDPFRGQIEDYESTLQDGKRIHVRELHNLYKAHWDRVSPLVDPIGHLRRDAPGWWIALCGLGGIVVGSLLSPKDRAAGAFAGGSIGVLGGIITLPEERQ